MGVYTVIAIAIIIYGICKDLFEQSPPKDKVFDNTGFNDYIRYKHLKGNDYLRARDKFYVTTEELERREKIRKADREYKEREKFMELYGGKCREELYDKYFKN